MGKSPPNVAFNAAADEQRVPSEGRARRPLPPRSRTAWRSRRSRSRSVAAASRGRGERPVAPAIRIRRFVRRARDDAVV
jgi:hypothetical protein